MILLYSYRDCFDEAKLRPGFRINGTLLVLTTRRPFDETYVKVPPGHCTGHYCNKRQIYLVLAKNQTATRYNNVSGGELHLEESLIERAFRLDTTDYVIHKTFYMQPSNLGNFTVQNGKVRLTTPIEGLSNAEAQAKFGTPAKLSIPEQGELVETEDFSKILIQGVHAWCAAVAAGTATEGQIAWVNKFEEASAAAAKELCLEILGNLTGQTAEQLEPVYTTDLLENVILGLSDQGIMAAALEGAGLPQVKALNGDVYEDLPIPVDAAALQAAIEDNQTPVAEGTPAEEIVAEKLAEKADEATAAVDIPVENAPAIVRPTSVAIAQPVVQLLDVFEQERTEDLADLSEEFAGTAARVQAKLAKIQARADRRNEAIRAILQGNAAPVAEEAEEVK